MNAQEVGAHWTQIRGKVKEKWGQLTDDDLQVVGGNIEQVVGRIQQKTGEARRHVEEFLDHLVSDGSPLARAKETAASYAQRAATTVQEGVDQVRDQARKGYEQTGEMIRRHPAESVAAVFGLGFVTGMIVGLLLRVES